MSGDRETKKASRDNPYDSRESAGNAVEAGRQAANYRQSVYWFTDLTICEADCLIKRDFNSSLGVYVGFMHHASNISIGSTRLSMNLDFYLRA